MRKSRVRALRKLVGYNKSRLRLAKHAYHALRSQNRSKAKHNQKPLTARERLRWNLTVN